MTRPAQLALFGAVKPAPPAPAPPAPPTKPRRTAGTCACAWSRGMACEALLSAPGDTPQRVAYHIGRGGSDTDCPGRKDRR